MERPLEQCISDACGQAGMCPWNSRAGVASSHLAPVEEPFPLLLEGHNDPLLCRGRGKYSVNCCQLSEVPLGGELLPAGIQSTWSPTTLMPLLSAVQNSSIQAFTFSSGSSLQGGSYRLNVQCTACAGVY